MKKTFLLLPLLAFLTSLLSGYSSSEMTIKEDVLARDPGFAEILEKKEAVDASVGEQNRLLREKEEEYREKMLVLKSELKEIRSQVRSRISGFEGSLEPEILALDENIDFLKEALREKKRLYDDLNKTSMSIERMIKKNEDVVELNAEIERWYERLASLRGQMIPLREDISQMENKLELEKKKRRLLEKFSLHLYFEKLIVSAKNIINGLIDKSGVNR